MTETKHTPGPWTLQTYQSGTVAVVMREWVGPKSKEYGHGYLAAHVNAFNIDFHGEREIQYERIANARLIAAAPDLLAACADALDIAEDLGLAPIASTLRAAIAKAEGR